MQEGLTGPTGPTGLTGRAVRVGVLAFVAFVVLTGCPSGGSDEVVRIDSVTGEKVCFAAPGYPLDCGTVADFQGHPLDWYRERIGRCVKTVLAPVGGPLRAVKDQTDCPW